MIRQQWKEKFDRELVIIRALSRNVEHPENVNIDIARIYAFTANP